MSTPNPLVPQGTNANTPKVRSNIKIAVATILAIHVVLFGGLLLQGCKPDHQTAAADQPTNALPSFDPGVFAAQQQSQAQPGQPVASATDPAPGLPAAMIAPPPMPALGAQPEVIAPPVAAAGEYTVKPGDSFEKIAKANSTTVKAITAANPGVDSRKLKINQKLVLPPPGVPATTAAAAPVETATPGFEIYSVKSGDSLTRIANLKKTSVKALRVANNLKTDNIKVGQKLKVPVRIVAEAPPAVLPQAAAPTVAPTAAPAGGQ
jgi:LysM repeat protein